MLFLQLVRNCPYETVYLYRLCQMCIHPCCQRCLHIFRKSICCHGNDWNLFSIWTIFHAPYSSSHRNYTTKYKEKVVVELNSADTTILQKIPGIGSSFSKRIVKYRALLGGFYTVEQLAEVYGIDEERYEKLNPWFRVDSSLVLPLHVNQADFRTLIRHPYLNKQQTVVILNCIKRKGKLSGWNELKLLEEFTEQDIKRLKPYLSFE